MTSFREAYFRFEAAGAQLVAISADSLASHERFAEKLGGVPFPLLSDVECRVIDAYGVLNDRGTGPRRSLFVVAPDGTVCHANPFYSVGNTSHFEAIFEALERA